MNRKRKTSSKSAVFLVACALLFPLATWQAFYQPPVTASAFSDSPGNMSLLLNQYFRVRSVLSNLYLTVTSTSFPPLTTDTIVQDLLNCTNPHSSLFLVKNVLSGPLYSKMHEICCPGYIFLFPSTVAFSNFGSFQNTGGGAASNVKFLIMKLPNVYEIILTSTGECLTVFGNSKKPRQPVWLTPCTNSTSQQWAVTSSTEDQTMPQGDTYCSSAV